MPTPICAAVIILTSFAPSPIASVVLWGLRPFIINTISAFYFGLTRQARTTFAPSHRSMNSFFRSSSYWIVARVSPSTITALSLTYLVILWLPLASTNSTLSFIGCVSLSMNMFMALCKRLHECPILIAVSTLSPVSTHTWIPAFLRS